MDKRKYVNTEVRAVPRVGALMPSMIGFLGLEIHIAYRPFDDFCCLFAIRADGLHVSALRVTAADLA